MRSSLPSRRFAPPLAWLSLCFALGSLGAPASLAVTRVREPFAGITYTTRTQTVPRPLSIHLVEIDTTQADISFLLSPSNGNAAGESSLQTVRQFATTHKTQVAINASFYFAAAGGGYDNRGLVASRGDVYSPFEGDARPWPVFNIGADNFAQIVNQATVPSTSYAITPAIPLYNAVSGSERIITNGRVTAGTVTYGEPTSLNPRTAIGLTADRRIVLICVDGRQAGFSEGMYNREVAELLIQYGVTDAVNLDGGGSTTLVLAEPTPKVMNRYSDPTERAVGTSLGVFAAPATRARDVLVYADFLQGEAAGFRLGPAATPGSSGLAKNSTNEVLASAQALSRGWLQRLTLRFDPTTMSPAATVRESWLYPHTWNIDAAGGENPSRPTRGSIGFRARTTSPGVFAAPILRDGDRFERATKQPLVADGAWHLYEWPVDQPSAWDPAGLPGANGRFEAESFALEAIQFSGPAADASIDLDLVAHHADGSLATEFTAPNEGLLANVSARLATAAGAPPAQLGLVLTPLWTSQVRPVLVRAIGPTLSAFGVTSPMSDPRLSLLGPAGRLVGTNDNWGSSTLTSESMNRFGAFALPAGSRDAALLSSLPPGSYHAQVEGEGGAVLIEAYADAQSPLPYLANCSILCAVNVVGEAQMLGFVVRDAPRRILVRAVGPSLTAFGVAPVLADPHLTLYAGDKVHAQNDDWGGGTTLTEAFSRTGAFSLPATSRDAALVVTLRPGIYTMVVRSASGAAGTGHVLLEAYVVP